MNKIALFPTVSNPPTFGIVEMLFRISNKFEKIHIIVQDKFLVYKPEIVRQLLEDVFCKFTDKFTVSINKTDFRKVSNLPNDLPQHNVIITDSPEIYANLASKCHHNCMLINKLVGYDESFHRLAYIRSFVLNNIDKSIRNIIKK